MTDPSETLVQGTIEDYSYNAKKDLRYEIRLTTGERLTVNRKLVSNRTRATLETGTPLIVTLRGGQVVSASVPATEPISTATTLVVAPPTAPDRLSEGDGTLVNVTPLYATVEFTNGERANLAYGQWKTAYGQWAVGTPIKARYSAARYEIIEIYAPNIQEERQFHWRGEHHGIHTFLELVRDHIEWYRGEPGRDAIYEAPSRPLPAELLTAITAGDLKINSFHLYRHQARALDVLRQGAHLLLVTQTASGKTLAFNPAIFETILTQDPYATALYIYPLNALRMDQKQKLEALATVLNQGDAYIGVEVIEAGQGQSKRQAIARGEPHLVGINPELLGTMLNEQGVWRKFFQRLRYIVVDEVHFYRGILGNHMAGLLRRLRLATQRVGATPQFILCSATVRDPLDLAERLTALPQDSFSLLDETTDGSQQAFKHWVVLSPNIVSSGKNGYLQAAAQAMVELLCSTNAQGQHEPLNTILFAKSTRAVNSAHARVVELLRKVKPELAGKVHKFVANQLNNEEKKKIFEGLRSGHYIGVVATNALEAGIDIGHLDVCILAGFPQTMMRMRQMAGRVGRRGEGMVLFVPQPGAPLDEFYRDHPNELLDQKPEVFTVDADNYYIARKHLNAAAVELGGLQTTEQQLFGTQLPRILTDGQRDGIFTLGKNGILTGSRRSFQNIRDPYAITNIRGNAQVPYLFCRAGNHSCPNPQSSTDCFTDGDSRCSHRIALIDQQYIFRDAHPGAIYEDFQSRLWHVTGFDLQQRAVRAEQLPDESLDRTSGREQIEIRILEEHANRPLIEGAHLHWGRVRVTRSVDEYAEYTLVPRWKCRRCKREFPINMENCPSCGNHTEMYYEEGKRKYRGFSEAYQGKFRIELETIGMWLTIPPAWESRFIAASPCRLDPKSNRVQDLAKHKTAPLKGLAPSETASLTAWHLDAHAAYQAVAPHTTAGATMLLPGIYGNCLMSRLRSDLPEDQARAVFQQSTGYDVMEPPATPDGKKPHVHICARCTTPQLLTGMHTLEHTLSLRYPSVVLGDLADLASYTTIAHPQTANPTIFWYDMVEGGSGAAEKIYGRFEELLQAVQTTLADCRCTRIEGCPRCTQLSRCERQNEQSDLLNKAAGILLSQALLNQPLQTPMWAYLYTARQKRGMSGFTVENEFVSQPPPQEHARVDPFDVLRVQRNVHDIVLERALEVRSEEIPTEFPPISAELLNHAYRTVLKSPRPTEWNLTESMTPYQVMQLLENASPRMVKRIYYAIVRELHPDRNASRQVWATSMMKLVNDAYDRIRKQQRSDDE